MHVENGCNGHSVARHGDPLFVCLFVLPEEKIGREVKMEKQGRGEEKDHK